MVLYLLLIIKSRQAVISKKTYKPKTEIQQENNYMNYNIDAMMSKMNEFDKNIENEQKSNIFILIY